MAGTLRPAGVAESVAQDTQLRVLTHEVELELLREQQEDLWRKVAHLERTRDGAQQAGERHGQKRTSSRRDSNQSLSCGSSTDFAAVVGGIAGSAGAEPPSQQGSHRASSSSALTEGEQRAPQLRRKDQGGERHGSGAEDGSATRGRARRHSHNERRLEWRQSSKADADDQGARGHNPEQRCSSGGEVAGAAAAEPGAASADSPSRRVIRRHGSLFYPDTEDSTRHSPHRGSGESHGGAREQRRQRSAPQGGVGGAEDKDTRRHKSSHRRGLSAKHGYSRSDASSIAGSVSGHADVARLAGELRVALAQAERRRRDVQGRLQSAETEAEAEEADLRGQLAAAREQAQEFRQQRQAASARGVGQQAQEAREVQDLRREVREMESERDAFQRESEALEAELQQHKAGALGQSRAASSTAPAGTFNDALDLPLDMAAVNAVGADALESMLRAEATALRTTLRFYRQHREDEARRAVQGTVRREEEALRELLQQQRNEAMALEDAEVRLQMGRACVADALAMRQPADETRAELEEMQQRVLLRQRACEELQETTMPLQDDCHHLRKLYNAAEAKIVLLEQALLAKLQVTVEQALQALSQTRLRGAAALTFVLAKRCGSPRIAFLALDINFNGRLSMCEFDSSLRIRLKLDYEAITGLKLRALFKEFDWRHCGVITEEDFSNCCPEIWAKYGRDDRSDPYYGSFVPNEVAVPRETEADEAVGERSPPRSEVTSITGEASAVMSSSVARSENASPGSTLPGDSAAGVMTLQVQIKSARGLHSPDGRNKPSPYCTCQVVARRRAPARIQTPVLESTLAPLWNHWFEICGCCAGDSLAFAVWSRGGPGRQDCLLGRVVLDGTRIQQSGFEGELALSDGARQQEAKLKVRVAPAGPS